MSGTHYPVWIGSLSPRAQEIHLKEVFGRYGTVASVKVMRDKQGISRKFGFVNFYSLEEAERAAQCGNMADIFGCQVIAKGPKDLNRLGRFEFPSSAPLDYRPLTDCLFFMEREGCTIRDKCPYRHSTAARASLGVCIMWKKKKCKNINCPMKHPGGKSGTTNGPKEPTVAGHKPKKSPPRKGPSKSEPHVRAAHSRSPVEHGAFSEGLSQSSEYTCGSTDSTGSSASESESDNSDYDDLEEPGGHSGFDGDEELSLYSPMHSVDGSLSIAISESLEKDGEESALSDGRLSSKSTSSSLSNSFSRGSSKEKSGSLPKTTGLNAEDLTPRKLPSRRKKKQPAGQDTGDSRQNNANSDSDYSTDADPISRSYSTQGNFRGGKDPDSSQQTKSEKKVNDRPSNDGGEGVRSFLLPSTASEPVGVFWDIENCFVPPGKSAFAVAQKIRKEFFESKREAEFVCVCDTMKENFDVTDGLNNAQVTVVHVNAVAKNAADDKLRAAMRKFAHNFQPPATVVLISGDINFASELSDMRDRHNFTVVLVHNAWCKEEFKAFAHKTYLWEEFIQGIEEQKKKDFSLPTEVLVKNLPPSVPRFKVRERLSMLSGNCGGKVMQVQTTSAVVRFATHELTIRAQKRMNRQDVFGQSIAVEMIYPANSHPPHVPQSHHKNFPKAGPFPPPPPPPPPHLQPPPEMMMDQAHISGDTVPYLDNPPSVVLKLLPVGTGRVVLHPISLTGAPDDLQALKRTKGEITQALVCAPAPVMIHPDIVLLWHDAGHLCAVVTVDIVATSEKRRDRSLRQGLAASMARLTVDIRSAVEWEVSPVTGYEGDLEVKITRSHVVHVLKQYKQGWVKLKDFRSHYTFMFELPCQEVDLKSVAEGVVDFLGHSSNRVIIFSHFSPLVRVAKKPSVSKRIVRLLESFGRVDLLSLVAMYEKNYGPLPFKKDGVELSDILTTLPLKWNIDQDDLANTFLSPADPPSSSIELDGRRRTFFANCAILLEGNGGRIRVKDVKPLYQTLHQQSLCVSDYGVSSMKDLLRLAPQLRLSEDDKYVTLVQQSPAARPRGRKGETDSNASLTREQFLELCCNLLRENGGEVSTSTMQQKFQTKYHFSPKVSLYGGATSMLELLQQCPRIQVRGKSYHLVGESPAASSPDRAALKKNVLTLVAEHPSKRVKLNELTALYLEANNDDLSTHIPKGYSLGNFINLLCCPEIELTGSMDSFVVQFSEICMAKRIEEFEKAMEEIILKKPEGYVLLEKVPVEFCKHSGRNLVLLEHGFKKLSSLVEALPPDSFKVEEINVLNQSSPVKVLRLTKATRKKQSSRPSSAKPPDAVEKKHSSLGSMRRNLEWLIYQQPNCRMQLVHVKPSYDKMFHTPLDYKAAGHPKLLAYLTSCESSFNLEGDGPCREVILSKAAVLAMNIFTLLRADAAGMSLSQLSPLYKKSFGTLVLKDFNHKKLHNLLKEDLDDFVEIHGISVMRKVYLADSTLYTGGPSREVLSEWAEILKFELAFLLYYSPEYTLEGRVLFELYLRCFGKKYEVLNTDKASIVQTHTPLTYQLSTGNVSLGQANVFACQMAEVMSCQEGKNELRMVDFQTAFKERFGYQLSPSNYGCETFKKTFIAAKDYMADQLSVKESHPCVKQSGLSNLFSTFGKVWKEELRTKTLDPENRLALEKLQTAIEKHGAVTLHITRCILIGPPRVGKSCFKNLLVRNEPGLVKESTPIMDAPVVLTRGASMWTQQGKGGAWKELTTVDLQKLVNKCVMEENYTSVKIDDNNSIAAATTVQSTVKLKPSPPKTAQTPNPLVSIDEHPQANPAPQQPEAGLNDKLNPVVPSNLSQKLSNFFQAMSRDDIGVDLNHLKLMHVFDCGGQLAFLDTIPLLINAPCAFIAIFNAFEGLDMEKELTYCVGSEELPTGHKETQWNLLLSILSGIQSLQYKCRQDIDDLIKDHQKPEHSSPIAVVGTHKDEIVHSNIDDIKKSIESRLRNLIGSKPCFFIRTKGQILHLVENLSTNDLDQVESLREAISDNATFSLDLALPWLILELFTRSRLTEQAFYPYSEFKKLCRRHPLLMDESEFSACIRILHILGFYAFYPLRELSEDENWICTDAATLYKEVSKLLMVQHVDPGNNTTARFKETGRIPLKEKSLKELFIDLSIDIRADPKWLMHVLLYLGLAAKIKMEEEEAFIPLALPPGQPDVPSKTSVAPLCFTLDFTKDHKYVSSNSTAIPRGTFSRLVVLLLSDQCPGDVNKWKIWDEDSKEYCITKRSCIKFRLMNSSWTVYLKESLDHIEVSVVLGQTRLPHTGDDHNRILKGSSLCQAIRKTLTAALKKAFEQVFGTSCQPPKVVCGFACSKCESSNGYNHIAIIHEPSHSTDEFSSEEYTAVCSVFKGKDYFLTSDQLIWFNPGPFNPDFKFRYMDENKLWILEKSSTSDPLPSPGDTPIEDVAFFLPYLDEMMGDVTTLGVALGLSSFAPPGDSPSDKCINTLKEWLKRTASPSVEKFCHCLEKAPCFNNLRETISPTAI